MTVYWKDWQIHWRVCISKIESKCWSCTQPKQ